MFAKIEIDLVLRYQSHEDTKLKLIKYSASINWGLIQIIESLLNSHSSAWMRVLSPIMIHITEESLDYMAPV